MSSIGFRDETIAMTEEILKVESEIDERVNSLTVQSIRRHESPMADFAVR